MAVDDAKTAKLLCNARGFAYSVAKLHGFSYIRTWENLYNLTTLFGQLAVEVTGLSDCTKKETFKRPVLNSVAVYDRNYPNFPLTF